MSDDDAGTLQAISCADVRCEAPATCIERIESASSIAECSCPTGYRSRGDGCEDIDECETTENACGADATCENRAGTFGCRCKPGFMLEGDTCKSLDTCSGVSNTCHPEASCSLTAQGAAQCACAPGAEGDGRSCNDLDECARGEASCVDNASCTNTRESFACTCDTLYSGNGKVECRGLCQDAQVDEGRCDPGGRGVCVVGGNGEAACTHCLPGYLGDGVRCASNAECGALDCGDNTRCAGEAGSRRCECAPGYTGNAAQGCTDINECAGGDNDCDPSTSRCLNLDGGHVCECLAGFERQDGACVNIDECQRDLDICDPNASCSDRTPGYECKCNEGYEGDGRSCADIDECQTGAAQCARGDSAVVCVNTRGGYDCKCPSGYAGDGENESCYCDLSGYWAMRQDAMLTFPERAVAGQVLMAKSVTYASIWELYRFEYDGDKIAVQKKSCGSDVTPELYSPLYDETYSSATPNDVYDRMMLVAARDIPLPRTKALPGSSFDTPRDAVVQGIRLDDPLNDPWPASFQDVPANRWVDVDDDGELGLSLWPGPTTKVALTAMGDTYSYLPVALQEGSTIIDRRLGCASVAVRAVGSLRVDIDTCSRLTGALLENKTEGRVHSCSVLRMADWEINDITCRARDWSDARRCTKDEVEFLDGQDQSNMASATFEMQKIAPLDAEADCAAVRSKLPAIVRNR